MKKFGFLLRSILGIALLVLLAACGNEGQEEEKAEGTGTDGSPESFTLSVGGAGETSWVYGALTTISETIKANGYSHVDMVVQTSPGSIPHPQLYEQGQIDLGSSTTSVDTWAMSGREEFYDKDYQGVYYAITPLNRAKTHIVVPADSDINDIRDLEGRSVFTGDPGTSILNNSRDILNALEIEVDEHSMDRAQAFQYLQDGRLDALMFTLGAPYSSVMELESSTELKLVPISEEDISIIEESLPDLTAASFEAQDEYDFVKESVPTVSNIQLLAGSAEVPEEQVYEVVKGIWESWDKINEQVPATKLVSEEDILNMTAQIHPGAIKYYEEIGIEIPEDLKP